MKNLIATIILFCISYSGKAQEFQLPNWRIGITPSTLIHWFPSVNLSLDKSIYNSTNLCFDAGYIFGDRYTETGIRTKIGIEKIFPAGSKAGYYFGAYIHGRYTSRLTRASRISNNGEYIEFSEYFNRNLIKVGLSGSVGTILQLSKNVYMEIGIGIGIRKITSRNSIELKENMTVQEEWFTDFDTLGFGYSHISFSHRLGESNHER